MTEDEAKGKWCPFARPGQVRPEDCGEVRGNRRMLGEVDDGALCIGSACMAWQAGIPIALKRVERMDTVTKATGYCGLAGKAE